MSKTAVITGATSGIGAAYAQRLASDGYDLIIIGRRREIIQKLADDITAQHKVKVKVIIAELSNDSDIQQVIDAIKADGNVAMLINNAGYLGDLKYFISKARTPCGLCRRDESPYIGWSVQTLQTPCALGTG